MQVYGGRDKKLEVALLPSFRMVERSGKLNSELSDSVALNFATGSLTAHRL